MLSNSLTAWNDGDDEGKKPLLQVVNIMIVHGAYSLFEPTRMGWRKEEYFSRIYNII